MTHFAIVDPTLLGISDNSDHFPDSVGINIETVEEVLRTGRLGIEDREGVIQDWVVRAEMSPDIKYSKPSGRDFFRLVLR